MAVKTTGEPLFGIEKYGECWMFPGLTQEQLASIPTGSDCTLGVGGDGHVQLFSFE